MITRIQTSKFNKNVFASSFSKAKIIRFCGDMHGFGRDHTNDILDFFNEQYPNTKLLLEYQLPSSVKEHYSNLVLDYDFTLWREYLQIRKFEVFRQHPDIDINNLLCTFNAKQHAGSRLLVSYLYNNRMHNPGYVSKNFQTNLQHLYKDIEQLSDNVDLDRIIFGVHKQHNEGYLSTVNVFGEKFSDQTDNLKNLSPRIANSFVYIVSENVSTGYIPYISEKFLYGVVNRSLFLAWAPPGWHKQLSEQFGFKLYDDIFDYSFDSIENPTKRLQMLMKNLAVYQQLSIDDWHDLRKVEIDKIQYNYEHFFSQKYLDKIQKTQYNHLD